MMFGDVLIVDDEREFATWLPVFWKMKVMRRGLRKIATVLCGKLPAAVRPWCCLMFGCKAVVWTGWRF